jgi:hypothetical protein
LCLHGYEGELLGTATADGHALSLENPERRIEIPAKCSTVSVGHFAFRVHSFRFPKLKPLRLTEIRIPFHIPNSLQGTVIPLWPWKGAPLPWPPPTSLDADGLQRFSDPWELPPLGEVRLMGTLEIGQRFSQT